MVLESIGPTPEVLLTGMRGDIQLLSSAIRLEPFYLPKTLPARDVLEISGHAAAWVRKRQTALLADGATSIKLIRRLRRMAQHSARVVTAKASNCIRLIAIGLIMYSMT